MTCRGKQSLEGGDIVAENPNRFGNGTKTGLGTGLNRFGNWTTLGLGTGLNWVWEWDYNRFGNGTSPILTFQYRITQDLSISTDGPSGFQA